MANLDEIKRVFEIIDENMDGVVSVVEISGFVNGIGITISEKDLTCLFSSICIAEENCSSVRFEEFAHLHQSVFTNEDTESKDLMEAFRVFDRNEDGYISSTELQQVLSSMGLIAQGQHCEGMICKFDSDCNGLLDFTEFKNMMASKF
ncbi:hypothetical protein SUGI_0209560 [Cryptomeria japonica]|uniref:calmodulin-like protein 7 n=1 Tax=Cryptomeria japonica TaxID=3369 RepID=UPI0024089EE9|nr:calmodulin-like protein 7 [Cryptomeria japonica]GLJ13280.1 hypothetical protein SUGI_0209560 [Cryptomeria japonica]